MRISAASAVVRRSDCVTHVCQIRIQTHPTPKVRRALSGVTVGHKVALAAEEHTDLMRQGRHNQARNLTLMSGTEAQQWLVCSLCQICSLKY